MENDAVDSVNEIVALVEQLELKLSDAFDTIQKDGHQWSKRPCKTCEKVSNLIGRPFGCVLYAEQRKK